MPASGTHHITDAQGARGRIDSDARSADGPIRVLLDDGSAVRVSPGLLEQQPDGHYVLDAAFEDLPAAEPDEATGPRVVEEAALPLVEEEVRIRKEKRETGRVRVRTRVHERTETIDEPLVREAVEVERVPVNRVLDAPASIREEGDTTIIPVVEERLVVKKELVLVEELHVTRTRTEHRDPQTVTLRRTEAEVERTDPSGEAPSEGAARPDAS